jgi:hypothetical protein
MWSNIPYRRILERFKLLGNQAKLRVSANIACRPKEAIRCDGGTCGEMQQMDCRSSERGAPRLPMKNAIVAFQVWMARLLYQFDAP